MAKLKVHLLNFHKVHVSHIEIVLENISAEPHTYYFINRGTDPRNSWENSGGLCTRRIKAASSMHSFEIEADSDEIVAKWRTYYFETKKNVFGENCAAAAQRFLTDFANIPEPSHRSNSTWNYLSFGIFWPSAIPCPVTLPGRVMDNAKFYTRDSLFRHISIDDLPEKHENKYLEETIKHLKQIKQGQTDGEELAKQALVRFNSINYGFFKCLEDINQKAIDLKERRYTNAADCANKLVENLQACVINYCENNNYQTNAQAFEAFKSGCLSHINTARSIFENRGLGRLFKSLILTLTEWFGSRSINKTATKYTTFFFTTNSMERVFKLLKELSAIKQISEAIDASPLKVISSA